MGTDLKTAKRLNKMAAVLIVIMLILMGAMLVNMQYLDRQYKQLEGNYTKLYDEMVMEKMEDLYGVE